MGICLLDYKELGRPPVRSQESRQRRDDVTSPQVNIAATHTYSYGQQQKYTFIRQVAHTAQHLVQNSTSDRIMEVQRQWTLFSTYLNNDMD
jgi:hypothetical protein